MSSARLRKRPLAGSVTGRVWEIADDLLRQRSTMPSGREVADIYVAQGGNRGTAFTQYSHWKKSHLRGDLTRNERAELAGDWLPDRQHRLVVGADGSVVIPADLRRAMDLDASSVVTARVIDGELRVVTPKVALEQARALVRAFDTGQGSPVDELIRERRADSAHE